MALHKSRTVEGFSGARKGAYTWSIATVPYADFTTTMCRSPSRLEPKRGSRSSGPIRLVLTQNVKGCADSERNSVLSFGRLFSADWLIGGGWQ